MTFMINVGLAGRGLAILVVDT